MQIEAFDFSTLEPLHERVSLDFANTTPHHIDLESDHLNSYADLISWGLDVDLLSEDQAQRLLELAARQPAEAEAVWQQAIDLRETIYRIMAAIARERPTHPDDFEHLNAALQEAMPHLRLMPGGECCAWTWAEGEDHLEQVLWPVVWDASELLRSDDLKYLRECDGQGCDWLFLDTSRNHSRRWCSMKTCGNRAKAKRHYHRAQSDDE